MLDERTVHHDMLNKSFLYDCRMYLMAHLEQLLREAESRGTDQDTMDKWQDLWLRLEEMSYIDPVAICRLYNENFTNPAWAMYETMTLCIKPVKYVVRAAIPKKYDALFLEYVNEAEHQDGLLYWTYFEDALEVLEDFNLYLGGLGPRTDCGESGEPMVGYKKWVEGLENDLRDMSSL